MNVISLFILLSLERHIFNSNQECDVHAASHTTVPSDCMTSSFEEKKSYNN